MNALGALRLAAALTTMLTVLVLAQPAAAEPIRSLGVAPSLPDFRGAAVQPRPLPPRYITHAPRNPYMAPGSNSNIHNDPWMTGAYNRSGPLGRSLVTTSQFNLPAVCGSIAFDSQNRLVSVCPSAALPPQARVIDPVTLETMANYPLPGAPDPPGTRVYQNFSGGGYFFLDAKDRIWAPTKSGHINVLQIAPDGRKLWLVKDLDLTNSLEPNERITSALPDYDGLVWFVTKKGGKVGTVNPRSGQVHAIKLGGEIQNSFTVSPEGVYIVSDRRLYRFRADDAGVPRIVWGAAYDNSGIHKPSQVNAGSGTTPDVMRGGYVAIADNADPMQVVVYRRAADLEPGESRKVCEVPVFAPGASATENSLITTGPSIIVENNYGYQNPLSLQGGALTEPGFTRVDIKRDGSGCRTVWENTDVHAPTVVPKLSTKTGLIYAYTRDPDPNGSESYYWTAIDFRSGRTVWQKYAGTGISYNNNYAGLTLGPDGTAYLATFGGMLSLRDGS